MSTFCVLSSSDKAKCFKKPRMTSPLHRGTHETGAKLKGAIHQPPKYIEAGNQKRAVRQVLLAATSQEPTETRSSLHPRKRHLLSFISASSCLPSSNTSPLLKAPVLVPSFPLSNGLCSWYWFQSECNKRQPVNSSAAHCAFELDLHLTFFII